MCKKAEIFRELVQSLCQYQVLYLIMLSVSELKLRMMVTVKSLLSVYNTKLSIIHANKNTKELCVFENHALSECFVVQYTSFFQSQTK